LVSNPLKVLSKFKVFHYQGLKFFDDFDNQYLLTIGEKGVFGN